MKLFSLFTILTSTLTIAVMTLSINMYFEGCIMLLAATASMLAINKVLTKRRR